MNDKKTTTERRHPEVTVELIGNDGTAFAVLAACKRAARKGGVSDEEIGRFYDEALAGNYEHLLATAMRWFNVE
jgi:hypothetical protein